MDIQADRSSSVLTGNGEAVLTGNVRIDQGSLAIRADRATVTQRDGEIHRVVFEGAPATLAQDADDGTRTRASARRIEYDLSSEVVELIGNVEVRQPQNVLRGERVTYNLATERLNAGGDSGPIRLRVAPRRDGADSGEGAGSGDDTTSSGDGATSSDDG